MKMIKLKIEIIILLKSMTIIINNNKLYKMKLQCGYLPGTNSMCYHPIQNVKFWGDNWKTCNIVLDGKIIKTITNNNQTVIVEQELNNSYGIELKVNGQKIYEHFYVYYVDLVFDSQPEYELIESMIVDH